MLKTRTPVTGTESRLVTSSCLKIKILFDAGKIIRQKTWFLAHLRCFLRLFRLACGVRSNFMSASKDIFCSIAMILLFFALSACERSVFAEDDLTLARTAYMEQNLPLAERLLERFLRENQNSQERWQAWELLLKVLNADRIHPRASLDCLDAMLVEYEDDPEKIAEILPQVANYNRQLRHFDLAAHAWNAYLELAGLDEAKRLNGYRQLAGVEYVQRHYEAAEDVLQQCLALPVPDKAKVPCMLDLAEGHMLRDHWQEVADLTGQILETEPEGEISGKANYLRADALEQLGKIDEALATFEKARHTYPNPLVIENRIEYLKKKNTK